MGVLPIVDSYVLLDDLRFHYRRSGVPGSDQPLVLLHGLASTARIWDLVAPLLARRRPVYALDQRGHGLTDKPDEGYGFEPIVRDLARFIEALNLEQPIVIGHSWGAGVALQYAALRAVGPWAPAGIGLIDGGLIQLSSLPGMTWDKAEQMLRPPPLAGMARDAFLERRTQYINEPALLAPEVVDIVLANFEISPDDSIRPRLNLARHMQIARALYEQTAASLYPRVRCPVLITPAVPAPPHAERTAQYLALQKEGEALARQTLARSRTHWFEDTVHDIPLHRPGLLAEVIEQFLAEEIDEPQERKPSR